MKTPCAKLVCKHRIGNDRFTKSRRPSKVWLSDTAAGFRDLGLGSVMQSGHRVNQLGLTWSANDLAVAGRILLAKKAQGKKPSCESVWQIVGVD